MLNYITVFLVQSTPRLSGTDPGRIERTELPHRDSPSTVLREVTDLDRLEVLVVPQEELPELKPY